MYKKIITFTVITLMIMPIFTACSKKDSPIPIDSSSSQIDIESSKEESSDEEYKSPIDFAQWQEKNPDIYAWIKIPGTNIDYPILQAPTDDEYYLRRTIERKNDIAGSLFTQITYNSNTFEDNHTVIYGHNMLKPGGGMFTQVADYKDKTFFDEHREIIIYMPDKELHYKVFAGYQWTDEHLLYNYNSRNDGIFENYLESIFTNKDLNANIDKTMNLTKEDKIITLSTCVSLNGPNRFLLQAVLQS